MDALFATVAFDTAPRAAELLLGAAARADVVVFAVAFVVALVTLFAAVFAPLVFAAVLVELEAVFVAALAADFAALFGRAAAEALLFTVDFATVLPTALFSDALLPALFLALLAGAVADAARSRADLAALFAEPREREAEEVTPAPFFFSFFVADGIRGTLPIRPAVETGRICRPLAFPARMPARTASLSI
ncbi:hypothetical protein [Methylocystis parvus]|uniref:Uncharacterized protein n=1 Tax=Methylocystis parvus TaxID=134 RepID=A0A6B8M958_9HYPH|nr:hypothetical protein [Methylocystis parvus]QGM99176.1 hypothetical protein F7D14_17905 [Methylocystis parvus]WBK00450.1 hypothetical protein MMG94_01625 [Methylocystis parvus OBBP]